MADAAGGDDAPQACQRNPFPGLRPFRTDEQQLFFGRERQIDRMVDKLAQRRFLAVVGTSGSGKSSLVNCGLRPALHRGYLTEAGADWRMASCRPGHDPIGALAQALAAPEVLFSQALGDGMSAEELVSGTLRMSGLGLVDIVRQARLPQGSNLLLVVDQFEELFRYLVSTDAAGQTQPGPGSEARRFVTLLLEAVTQTALPIYIVLTMRSDYLGDCAQFYGLPEVMNEGQYLVPRLARDEIRAAITGPVSLAGAQISPVLLTRLLNDVGDNPDQLSILQHALNRTWANWEHQGGVQGPLDLAHYEAIGGMRQALDLHAEKAYAELAPPATSPAASAAAATAAPPSPAQQLATRIFRAITDKGTDARGIRRPTALAELCAICAAGPAEVEAVLAVFRKGSRSFLMPPEGEPLLPGSRIDISHESLMRVWRRLDRWADEEANAARQLRRLADSAEMQQQLYGSDNDKPAGLLSDRELDLALDWQHLCAPNAAWATQYGGRYELVQGFIARSRKLRLAGRVDAEIDLRWRTRGRLILLGAVGLLFIVLNIALTGNLSGWLTGRLGQLVNDSHSMTGAGVGLLSHVLVGLPALLFYDFLEPRLRGWQARRSRPAISAEIAAADVAPAVAAAAKAARAAAAAQPAPVHAVASDPLAADPATGTTPAPGIADAEHAPAIRRLFAALIDLPVALLLWLLLVLPVEFIVKFIVDFIGETIGLASAPSDAPEFNMLLVVTAVAGVCAISAYSQSSWRQATLGKRLLGLRVTDRHGQRLSFKRAYARQTVKLLNYSLLWGLGWLPLLFGRHRQALPDWVAGTRVLRRIDRPGG